MGEKIIIAGDRNMERTLQSLFHIILMQGKESRMKQMIWQLAFDILALGQNLSPTPSSLHILYLSTRGDSVLFTNRNAFATCT